ncbi:MAG: GntR family transcriptional regulator, partial [Propionicimonas sp.]
MPVPVLRGLHQRSLLRDDVYRSLRDAIVHGELAPGEQLRDAELSAWLGVSRTPIREALLRLQRAGLVRATPGRVTLVAPEDPDAVRDAQQVAAELHALAVRLAAPRLDASALEAMRVANAALVVALATD